MDIGPRPIPIYELHYIMLHFIVLFCIVLCCQVFLFCIVVYSDSIFQRFFLFSFPGIADAPSDRSLQTSKQRIIRKSWKCSTGQETSFRYQEVQRLERSCSEYIHFTIFILNVVLTLILSKKCSQKLATTQGTRYCVEIETPFIRQYNNFAS